MKKSLTRLPVKPKSSPDARRLLEAVYQQEGSWPKVARRLGLGSPAAAWMMHRGRMGDTPEMKVVLKYARRRSRLAFAGIRLPKQPIDMRAELIKQATGEVRRALSILNSLMEEPSNDSINPTPTRDLSTDSGTGGGDE